MTSPFKPRLEILPAAQLLLWPELAEIPSEFTLYGGTALALHLGHRQSIDFDFFGTRSFEPQELLNSLSFLRDAQIQQQQANTLTCLVSRGSPVKISFFGLPGFATLAAPLLTPDNGLKIASLLDLAGTKAAVVQQRAEAKDYIDIDALLSAGVSLEQALSAAATLYAPRFNPQITLKALAYFDDSDVPSIPAAAKERLLRAVAVTNLSNVTRLRAL